jgi:hypothetical protein
MARQLKLIVVAFVSATLLTSGYLFNIKMLLVTSPILSGIAIAAFSLVLWQLNKIGRRPKDYPPGPPTLPIIGNLHLIPKEKRHLQFEKWSREYGPIYSLILGTRVMIVLSSDKAIKELVDRRSAIYASRPDSYVAQDILSGGLRVLFMVGSFWQSWIDTVHFD